MAQELKQELRLVQKLVLTPQLQQAIKLLQLTRLELLEHVNQELCENPVLEEYQDGQDGREGEGEDVVDSHKEDLTIDAILKGAGGDDSWGTYTSTYSGSFADSDEKQQFIENTCIKKTSLLDHLMWQLRMNNFSEEEIKIGTIIAGNLNDDGYLTLSIEEVSERGECEPSFAEDILKRIQMFDPVGVASRDLKECLRVQAEYYEVSNPVVLAIIDEYLPKLSSKNYDYIAKKLGVDKKYVMNAIDVITALEPKPGRSFVTEEPKYITPDVYVFKFDNEYLVTLNDNGLPRLRINKFYRDILRDGSTASEGAKDFIKERIKSATWLIKSIQQRQRTMYKVAKSIITHQEEFLEKGAKYLKPLVLRDVAQDVEVHESTVSRVTNGKYIHTPRGVFELKFFFTTRVASNSEDGRSMESVKSRIKELISGEDPKRPITDKQIVRLLESEGVFLARRTIAKYREMMGILSSAGRRGG
ncbi:MAG: RNA polymerase factor sigma-54 [Deltaproteobacteria bacterium]|uniref:RNA polymerase factor sigma-54 n=1 Tax=Candidatus Zymogenus saltonus TaxID=2844893 RepID=A0A9D8KJJ2_9DELT|nr:RNA polymerase factor sigma-54 [Candidatus Zymogenus saltonus]